ncbi:MAG TPA: FAD-binding oxidoreductase [Candidatus Limnocylindrales bacterium]|nr:FAD-binding oxidoreductase [Candidatus Limnocylindrales bacterium]
MIDPRQVEADAPQYNATLVARSDETSSLAYFTIRFDAEPVAFEPGQYMTIGVMAGGKIVQRPYSVASSPRTAADGYELYVRLVEGGLFTPLLWELPLGHRMRMIGPKGKFTLQPDDPRTHLFISSGTGNAPFVSMIRTLLIDGLARRVLFLNGVSYQDELGYRDLVEGWQRDGAFPVTYVPSVSRAADPRNATWTGRWGRVEAIVEPVVREYSLTPDNAIAYICGNPDMILNADATFQALGFPEESIRKELYWPKGKEPKMAAAEGVDPAVNDDE